MNWDLLKVERVMPNYWCLYLLVGLAFPLLWEVWGNWGMKAFPLGLSCRWMLGRNYLWSIIMLDWLSVGRPGLLSPRIVPASCAPPRFMFPVSLSNVPVYYLSELVSMRISCTGILLCFDWTLSFFSITLFETLKLCSFTFFTSMLSGCYLTIFSSGRRSFFLFK